MREWWIEFLGDPFNDKENYKRYVGADKFDPVGPNAEVIHVIEARAFYEVSEKLEIANAKILRLVEALENIAAQKMFATSREELQSFKICEELALEALEKFKGGPND